MYNQIFMLISSVLIITSSLVYLRSVLKGETKIERGAFFLWALIWLIIFFAQLVEGLNQATIISAIFSLSSIIFFLLSFKYGYGNLKKRDKWGIVIASFGLLLWVITDQPLVAIFSSLFVEAVAGTLLLIKTYEAPYTESLISWVLYLFGVTVGLLAIERIELIEMVVPVYVFIWGLAIVSILIVRRKQITKGTKAHS